MTAPKLKRAFCIPAINVRYLPRQISTMIDEIENQIFNREEKEIPTSVIGELVMDKLKSVDEVAYVRFASVYREFKDVSTFMEELGKLLKEVKSKRK